MNSNPKQDGKTGRFRLQTLEEKFFSKIEKVKSCWVWNGTRHVAGYGSLYHNGRVLRASRASWIIHHGRDPGNLFVLHRCDNPPCVNPGHLFLGNQSDNNRDKALKYRAGKKLTPDLVREIRMRHARGETNGAKLAREYKISSVLMLRIFKRQEWKYL